MSYRELDERANAARASPSRAPASSARRSSLSASSGRPSSSSRSLASSKQEARMSRSIRSTRRTGSLTSSRTRAAPILLTQEHLLERLPPHERRSICIDRDVHEDARPDAPPSGSQPETLPTSSTRRDRPGRPKGVLVEHRHVARLFTARTSGSVLARRTPGRSSTPTLRLLGLGALGPPAARRPARRAAVWTTRSPQLLAELLVDEASR